MMGLSSHTGGEDSISIDEETQFGIIELSCAFPSTDTVGIGKVYQNTACLYCKRESMQKMYPSSRFEFL